MYRRRRYCHFEFRSQSNVPCDYVPQCSGTYLYAASVQISRWRSLYPNNPVMALAMIVVVVALLLLIIMTIRDAFIIIFIYPSELDLLQKFLVASCRVRLSSFQLPSNSDRDIRRDPVKPSLTSQLIARLKNLFFVRNVKRRRR